MKSKTSMISAGWRILSKECVHLTRGERRLRVNFRLWVFSLAAAADHAWKPAGTKLLLPSLPPFAEQVSRWDGNYTSSEGQMITTEDALALAEAMQRTMEDIEGWDLRELVDFLRDGSCSIE